MIFREPAATTRMPTFTTHSHRRDPMPPYTQRAHAVPGLNIQAARQANSGVRFIFEPRQCGAEVLRRGSPIKSHAPAHGRAAHRKPASYV